jgi:FtsZ-binding cell division protein ZapB
MAEAPAKITGDLLKDNPLKAIAAVLVALGGIYGAVEFGLGRLEVLANDNAETAKKAGSAMEAVSKVQGAMDTFIMLQREANQLKREEMAFQGMRVKTQTVSIEESSSSRESSHESSASRSTIVTTTGMVYVEYVPDSLRSGIIRKGDTTWLPVDTLPATRPR